MLGKMLDVIYQLPNTTGSFPRHVIHLLSHYFGYHTIQVCPFEGEETYKDLRNYELRSNTFVSLNIKHSDMKRYNEYYAKMDIFNLSRVSPELRVKKVLAIRDIMPYEEFVETEYYEFLMSMNVHYEMRAFLKNENRHIAAISLYKRKEEGDFTDEEVLLFNYMSDYISKQFAIAMQQNFSSMVRTWFDNFFGDSKMGAVLLDDNMTIQRSNERARSYGEEMSNMLPPNEKTIYLDKLYRVSDQEISLQRVMFEVGLKLIQSRQEHISGDITHKFRFFCIPCTGENILGNIENYNLVLIVGDESSGNKDIQNLMASLTARERDILGQMISKNDNEAIAESLNISIYTVRTHVANIYKKFGVNSRVELLLKMRFEP